MKLWSGEELNYVITKDETFRWVSCTLLLSIKWSVLKCNLIISIKWSVLKCNLIKKKIFLFILLKRHHEVCQSFKGEELFKIKFDHSIGNFSLGVVSSPWYDPKGWFGIKQLFTFLVYVCESFRELWLLLRSTDFVISFIDPHAK